jgi:hypothetical protein
MFGEYRPFRTVSSAESLLAAVQLAARGPASRIRGARLWRNW